MKKYCLITTAFLCIISTAVFSVSAQSKIETGFHVKVTVNEQDHQKLMVTVSNPAGEKLNMIVSSYADGHVVDKPLNGTDYRGCLDFSTAVDGDYFLEISNKKQQVVRTVSIRTLEYNERSIALSLSNN